MFTHLKRQNVKNAISNKTTHQKKDEEYFAFNSNILYLISIFITVIKVLLIPTYRSTDFEVHRNWLAITHSLPISEWYTSNKSHWTLDYPPLFGWFEYALSNAALFVDPEMLNVDNLNYQSSSTIWFQRITVIVTDCIFFYGVKEVGRTFHTTYNKFIIFGFLSLCNVGLLMVDHIHFQYNGFLTGILLLSIADVSKTRKVNILRGALYFAALLNFKHIYLYVAPSFIVWLLKWYCLRHNNFFANAIQLGVIVIFVTVISFGPFVSQLPQVFSRLFPFKRGLVHAYWAANAWALYICVDKLLAVLLNRLNWLSVIKTGSMTGGLVGEDSLTVLPTPTPFITFVITALSMSPILVCLLRKRQEDLKKEDFVRCLILCALCSFALGWHVHEKALLTAIIPLGILAATNEIDARLFLILSAAGNTALLPLLFPSNLTLLKIPMTIMYTMTVYLCLRRLFHSNLLKLHEWIYVFVLPAISVYETVFHRFIFGDKLPFLPLALTSSYCAIGVMYSWIMYYCMYLFNKHDVKINK